ncbi:DUF397 domain-containing protein [Streptomyces fradiae]|uniref:DUF397 domain-containing protein n=1 Tax=Streptomyces fradiae TaxID=1906 RepID=UPI002019DE8F|nr:DUF397 domain-containing protein [Streptomyces fradiae]UQS28119.1 DUF397 domain-containing protein [Streptomyces fradiae]
MTERTIPNAAILSGWRKSSYSSGDGGSCVEVLVNYPPGVSVRDSKNPYGPAFVVMAGSWEAFTCAVKSNLLDR